ncbi:hypothetical protein HYW20_03005 [Candidatus Woesearchaeota archaeon]|nr:hypothetical protein [Candidatus Woesearchaeota archaeon]
MVKSKNNEVVKVFHSASNIEEVLENGGMWSAARLLLKDTPIKGIEAHYKKKRREYDNLTEQLASITLNHFARDSTFKSNPHTEARLADIAVNLHLAPKKMQEDYKKLKSVYFVFSYRDYGKTGGVKKDISICEFGMLPEETRQDGDIMVLVWRKLPLERLVNIHAIPENSDKLFLEISKYGLSVNITEVRKEYKPVYHQRLYGNK